MTEEGKRYNLERREQTHQDLLLYSFSDVNNNPAAQKQVRYRAARDHIHREMISGDDQLSQSVPTRGNDYACAITDMEDLLPEIQVLCQRSYCYTDIAMPK